MNWRSSDLFLLRSGGFDVQCGGLFVSCLLSSLLSSLPLWSAVVLWLSYTCKYVVYLRVESSLFSLIAEDTNWFPKENMFSFQTATTTMQAWVLERTWRFWGCHDWFELLKWSQWPRAGRSWFRIRLYHQTVGWWRAKHKLISHHRSVDSEFWLTFQHFWRTFRFLTTTQESGTSFISIC